MKPGCRAWRRGFPRTTTCSAPRSRRPALLRSFKMPSAPAEAQSSPFPPRSRARSRRRIGKAESQGGGRADSRRHGRIGAHERQRGRERAQREPDRPLSRLELLRGFPEGGHEGRVALQEFLPGLLARRMAGGRRRLLGLVGAEVRLLPQDRLGSQRLEPSRLPVCPRFRLDLLDQIGDPLPVLLRRQVRQQGSCDSSSSSPRRT